MRLVAVVAVAAFVVPPYENLVAKGGWLNC